MSEKVPSRDGILARMSKRYSLRKEEMKHMTGRGNKKLITERYTRTQYTQKNANSRAGVRVHGREKSGAGGERQWAGKGDRR